MSLPLHQKFICSVNNLHGFKVEISSAKDVVDILLSTDVIKRFSCRGLILNPSPKCHSYSTLFGAPSQSKKTLPGYVRNKDDHVGLFEDQDR